jgi:hypothetical protein
LEPKILFRVGNNVHGISPNDKFVLEELMSYEHAQKCQSVGKIRHDIGSESADRRSDKDEVRHHGGIMNLTSRASDKESIFEHDEGMEGKQPSDTLKRGSQVSEESTDEILEGPPDSHMIEITLRADFEFFRLLSAGISSIDSIQANQKTELSSRVINLGESIVMVTRPSQNRCPSDLYAWRELFSLYQEASVFFATTERDHGARTVEKARERMLWFSNQLASKHLVSPSIFGFFIV